MLSGCIIGSAIYKLVKHGGFSYILKVVMTVMASSIL